jgi:hypothetical protein
MSCRYDDIVVQITKINKIETEKCFNGRTTVYGVINISSEDENDFQEEFIYKGKANESKSKILNMLEKLELKHIKTN